MWRKSNVSHAVRPRNFMSYDLIEIDILCAGDGCVCVSPCIHFYGKLSKMAKPKPKPSTDQG